jgi:predicted transposase
MGNSKHLSISKRVFFMYQIITAKLKLITTSEQFAQLRQTQLAYRDALNAVSHYAFEHGKTSSADKLQKGMYTEIRMRYKLPAQMACNVPRQVGATYKGLWTKLKKNIEHRRDKRTKKRFKGLDQPPKYISPTLTYNYGRDYGFKVGQQVSISTLQGRLILGYNGYDSHIALIQQSAAIGAAKLWYDKPHKQFYLLVSLDVEVADPGPTIQQHVVGVDVGQRYLATVTTIDNKSQFFSGKAVRARADHYARLRKRLQRKGTRSAKRRMITLSGRERRFKLNTNHVIAKTIVIAHTHTLIGLEDLTGIHERTNRRKRRRKGKHVLPLTAKQRRANRHASKWAFAELHTFIVYKAALSKTSFVVKVDADYTSKACPMCGYTDKRNRPNNGLTFECQNKECGYRMRTSRVYRLHADLIGARNIAMRTLLIRQDWVRTGHLSLVPDVSDSEAKAARLKRYAEVRWSPDTSPPRERRGV